ncbi:hypothetical protein ACE3MS_20420 [Paenibacillus dendritiformis]|uniref:hypothetical protein n=1 Tax=Paenibacillus dendritiformis TaxID=130049 RepID=UPI003652639B
MSIQGDILTQINKSITGVTEQTRAHPDDFNPNVLKPLLDNDVTINQQLEALPSKPISFNPGYQIVESEYDVPFKLGEIKGRTLVNLLGRAGACDNLSAWLQHKETGNPIFSVENSTIKIVTDVGETSSRIARFFQAGSLKSGRFYIVIAKVKCSAVGECGLYVAGSEIDKNTTTNWEILCSTLSLSSEVDGYLVVGGAVKANVTTHIDDVRLYEISESEYKAIASMTSEQVAAKYPYVDSMNNVTNPYAIVTGGNLLPPFYDGWAYNVDNGSTFIATGPYTLSLEAKANNQQAYCDISVVSNTTYFIGLEQGKYAVVGTSEGTPIIVDWTSEAKTFNSGNETLLRVYLGNYQDGTGAFTFDNPMLFPGTEPKPFTPQQRSMLAFETELAANPIDGSNPDTLFMGDDGLPYVLEKWRKRYVGTEGEWLFVGSKPSHKTVGINGYAPDADPSGYEESLYATKYNGQTLIRGTAADLDAGADVIYVYGGGLRISIANTDSGWGPDYNPKQDEIKAFHLGWKMFDTSSSTAPYNRTDGLHKGWVKIYCGVGIDGGIGVQGSETTVLPSVMNDMGYTPYRLQYLKAKPTVEPVRNYELGATLSAGSNMVEVGSGIVIREKVNPPENINASTAGRREINYTAYPSSKLNYRTATIIDIYRSYASDRHWTISNGTQSAPVINSYGLSRANISGMYYDPTANYHVTYTMLDPTLPAPISGTVAANLRGTVSDLVQDVGDVQRRLSVVETQKAEKDVPQWIRATLLNNWINYDSSLYRDASYRKDSEGNVYFEGLISSGSIVPGTTLFTLPAEYRPSKYKLVGVVCSDGNNSAAASVAISPSGFVSANRVPHNAYLSLIGVSFRTD